MRIDSTRNRCVAGRRAFLAGALLALDTDRLARAATAPEVFPGKPVRLVVPYPPGGSNDNAARLLSLALSDRWRQPVVVENKPGGGGIVGAELVARAPADGHTLALVSSSFIMSAAVQPKLPFDPIRDFAAVARLQSSPYLVLVSPTLPARDLRTLIALAARCPGGIRYGSSGVGSSNQFATELLASMANIRLTHVPYKGMSPATADLAGGHLDLLIASVPSAHALLMAGKVRALAITSAKRAKVLPAIPTVAESGVPGYSFSGWSGVLAPAGTPNRVLLQLNQDIERELQSTAFENVRAMDAAEFEPSTPAGFGSELVAELQRWKQVARNVGIKPE